MEKQINTFEYVINEKGQYEVNGVIDYSKLKECCFLVIENNFYNTFEYYIVYKEHSLYVVLKNIFNEQEVYNTINNNNKNNNRKKIVCERLENYLYATNNIKANYTKEDVEQILEGMKENYLKENNKQLVKEK